MIKFIFKFTVQSHIPEVLNEDVATERAEKRREIKKAKREREKIKKKEEEARKFDEDERIRFVHLSDREKVVKVIIKVVFNANL